MHMCTYRQIQAVQSQNAYHANLQHHKQYIICFNNFQTQKNWNIGNIWAVFICAADNFILGLNHIKYVKL